MPIVRLHDPLSLTLIRKLGDAGGPRGDHVSEELNNIISAVNRRVETYFVDFTDRQTDATTNEIVFSTNTTAANFLAADGDFFIVYSNGTFAANANSKRYRIKFNSSNIFDTGTAAFNAVDFTVLLFAIRKSSSTLRSGVIRSIATVANAERYSLTAQNFATTNVLESTGQNSVASAGDVVQNMFFVLKGSV